MFVTSSLLVRCGTRLTGISVKRPFTWWPDWSSFRSQSMETSQHLLNIYWINSIKCSPWTKCNSQFEATGMSQVSRSALVSPAEGSIDESVLALCLNTGFIRFILSLQPFTFLIPDLFYLTVTVSLWSCFSSYAEALMYLIYSYQYNKELLSKGLYRGHSEELLGHYRRECLLVSRRSSWNNMSNPRGKQAVCLFLSSKLNKLQNGHRDCSTCVCVCVRVCF